MIAKQRDGSYQRYSVGCVHGSVSLRGRNRNSTCRCVLCLEGSESCSARVQ